MRHSPQSMGCQEQPGFGKKFRRIGNQPLLGQDSGGYQCQIQGDCRKGQLCHGGESKERFLGFGDAARDTADGLCPAQ